MFEPLVKIAKPSDEWVGPFHTHIAAILRSIQNQRHPRMIRARGERIERLSEAQIAHDVKCGIHEPGHQVYFALGGAINLGFELCD